MEKIQIARIFTWFPLIGMIMPDVLAKFSKGDYKIPTAHLFIEITLGFIIAVLTIVIYVKSRNTTLIDNKLKGVGSQVI